MDTRLKVVIGHKYIRMDRRFEEKCVDFRNERRWIPSRDHLKMLSCHLVYKNAFTKYLGVVCTCCSRGDHPSHLIKFCQRPNNNSQSIVNFPLQWLATFTLRPERQLCIGERDPQTLKALEPGLGEPLLMMAVIFRNKSRSDPNLIHSPE